MLYETDECGVLTDMELINIHSGIPSCQEGIRITHLRVARKVAQAQHQATRKATLDEVREKVKGLESPLGTWDAAIKAVLKALGEAK